MRDGSEVVEVRGRSAVSDMKERRAGRGEVVREGVVTALMALRKGFECLEHARADVRGVEREKLEGEGGVASARRRVCGEDSREHTLHSSVAHSEPLLIHRGPH